MIRPTMAVLIKVQSARPAIGSAMKRTRKSTNSVKITEPAYSHGGSAGLARLPGRSYGLAMPTIVKGLDELRAKAGEHLGYSDWQELTQDQVNLFADATGDHQWIHVDVERAKKESPFGTTVAHGNLTLSLIDGLRIELLESTGFKLGVNYGWNKVRFPAPVPSGSRSRATAEVVEVEDVGGGWFQIVTRFAVEVEGNEKPACVADSVGRALPE